MPRSLLAGWRFVRAFARDEDGSMIVFGLLMLVLMLMVAGMSVDIMRHEGERARLQSAIDRSALAAASITQTRGAETVARDHFEASGYPRDAARITSTSGLNGRQVTLAATATQDTLFMRLLGVPRLGIPASAVARETVTNVEISLVIDISGSMRYHSRLTNMKAAATSFVNQVLTQARAGTTSINLVPYAGSTNPGPAMFDYLAGVRNSARGNGNSGQGNSGQGNGNSGQGNSGQGNSGQGNGNSGQGNSGQGNGNSGQGGGAVIKNVSSCLEIPIDASTFRSTALPARGAAQVPHFMHWRTATGMDWGWCPEDDTSIIYASNDATALTAAINGFQMHDGTGTHIAMKWAVALLDPATQPAFAHLAAPERGLVPTQFQNRPAGWADTNTRKYIVLMTDGEITEQFRPAQPLNADNNTIELERQNANRRTERGTKKGNVDNFNRICDAAKAEGITVFTIAFHIDPGLGGRPQQQMRECASSEHQFYETAGTGLSTAFNQIAGQINALRLVQ